MLNNKTFSGSLSINSLNIPEVESPLLKLSRAMVLLFHPLIVRTGRCLCTQRVRHQDKAGEKCFVSCNHRWQLCLYLRSTSGTVELCHCWPNALCQDSCSQMDSREPGSLHPEIPYTLMSPGFSALCPLPDPVSRPLNSRNLLHNLVRNELLSNPVQKEKQKFTFPGMPKLVGFHTLM